MKQYHDLLKAILERGSYKEPAREGMPGTLSLFGYQNHYDLSEGFPILTTKKVNFQNIVVELLWFLRGDTNIKFLIDNGCNIWNQDAYNYYQRLRERFVNKKSTNISFEDFVSIVKRNGGQKHSMITDYKWGDCGFQYGRVWRQWPVQGEKEGWGFVDQIAEVIKNIREKPFDRRKLVTAVDPANANNLALYWCHALFQFNCRKMTVVEREEISSKMGWGYPGSSKENREEHFAYYKIPEYKLDCQMYQRSADVFLGVPYNISSYALLTHIIAKICNMVPGEFIHTFGDVHIYDNHRAQVDEIIKRDYTTYKLPTLEMNESLNWKIDIDEIDSLFLQMKPVDFKLENYDSYPTIKAELSTGMKP